MSVFMAAREKIPGLVVGVLSELPRALGIVLPGLLVLAMAGCGNKPAPVATRHAIVATEPAAVKAVEKLGGRVTVDGHRPGAPIVGVDFKGTQVTDAALKELKELKHLQSLDLFGTK